MPPAPPRASALADALDRLLGESAPAERRAGVLALQCQLVNARAGVLLAIREDGLSEPIAAHAGDDPALAERLWKRADELFRRAPAAGVAPLAGDALHIALQPLAGTGLVSALAFEAPSAFVVALTQERLELTARLLWAAERDAAASAHEARLRRLVDVIETLAALESQPATRAAALALANETQTRFGVSRVAVGLLPPVRLGSGRRAIEGLSVRLEAVSGAAELSPQLGARRGLEEPMQRAIDEDRDLALVPDAGAPELEGGALVALPLRAAGAPVGALALLHAADARIADHDLEALRLLAELVGPRLADRRLRELAPIARLRSIAAERLLAARRRGRAWRIGALPVALAALALVALFPARRRIEAPFVLQPVERRVVTAPFDGKIAAADVRPGDRVEAHQTVIARLDTSELALEAAALGARRATELQRAALARGEGNPSAEQRALLTAEQAAAEIRLLQHRIESATLVAPVSGVLLAGDLRQRIGAPVERGTPLAEVAPLEGLRAELAVPEDEVLDVEPGQRGALATAARPGESIAFEVERVEPLASLADGENSFRVLVQLERHEGAAGALLPGMQGVAKIEAGRTPLAWQTLRRVVNALRMFFWI